MRGEEAASDDAGAGEAAGGCFGSALRAAAVEAVAGALETCPWCASALLEEAAGKASREAVGAEDAGELPAGISSVPSSIGIGGSAAGSEASWGISGSAAAGAGEADAVDAAGIDGGAGSASGPNLYTSTAIAAAMESAPVKDSHLTKWERW